MKRLLYKCLLLGVVLFASSCGKDWLTELADNPNAPSESPLPLVLPAILTNYASILSTHYQNEGAWMGYTAYSGGYSIDNNTISYFLNSGDGDWNNWFNTLKNVNYLETQAHAQENMDYFEAAAKILKSFGFQYLVDSYNEAPYTEAFKGSENFFPSYDKGQDIYADCIQQLDSAIILIQNAGSEATALGDNDVMFHGDMSKWKAFANTLKLKFLLRESNVVSDADAKAELAKTDSIGYLAAGALVNPGYLNSDGKQSPFWGDYGTSPSGSLYSDGYKYRYAGGALLYFLRDNKDKRLFHIYTYDVTPSDNDFFDIDTVFTDYDAAYYGDRTTARNLNNGAGSATIGTGILRGYDAAIPLISLSNSYFMQAEAALRGWTSEDPEEWFNAGITASFEYLQVDDADNAALDYYTNGTPLCDWSATPSGQDDKLKAIITQKWVANAILNNYESWAEYRRTGFPSKSILPLTKLSGASRHIPTKYMFPKSESDRNQDAYKKAVANGNDPQNSKIFWMQ